MTGTVLDAGDMTVNKIDLVPAVAKVIFQDGLGGGGLSRHPWVFVKRRIA